MEKNYFKTSIAENVFRHKYAQGSGDTWRNLAKRLVEDVCGTMNGEKQQALMSREEREELVQIITDMKFIPGGRYLYYAGRPLHAWNNCYLLKGESDTREEWGNLLKRASDCLMTGGGIGIDYSIFRPEGHSLSRTGGRSSGPIPLMNSVNEVGRNVMQGGSRRCLKYSTMLATPTGPKRIEKIKEGDLVKTNTGNKKVLAKEYTGQKPIYEIHTRCGVIESTAEHRHAVIRNIEPFEVEWVETKNLTDQDTLVYYVNSDHNKGDKELTPFDGTELHFNAKPYTRPSNMSTDFAWLLGALCDGCCAERGVVFTQRENNVEFLNKIQRICREIFNLESPLTNGHDTLEVKYMRRQLSRDLKRYKSKRQGQLIHEDILSAGREEKLAFIAGVLDADGTIITTETERDKGTVNFRFACSIDKDWIYDLSALISSVGIPNRVRRQSNGREKYNRQPMYRIDLADKEFADSVANELSPYSIKISKDYEPVGTRKQAAHALVVTRSGHNTPRVMGPMDYRSFNWPEGVLPAKIESVVLNGDSDTYDIQVEDDECFVANGHLTHNSAIYASINWKHEDSPKFLKMKNWFDMPIGSQKKEDGTPYSIWDAKQDDFNYHAPLDMTNVSLNYDDAWLNQEKKHTHPTFLKNCYQAMKTGEPGFSFNFGSKQNETLRNACTEVTSEDDSDVCNLGSINLGNIDNIEEFKKIVALASKFLVCGTVRADLPYKKVHDVREKNRRLGLGLMGIHEWLLKRRSGYEVTPELHQWLIVYRDESERAANEHCDRFYLSRPKAYRAIAPTGSIGILASTTTGIEPLFAVAYKRRYLKDGTRWHYEYVIDSTADYLIKEYGLNPQDIDTAYKLSHDFEQRIRFQADVQDYVDMSISSTINLPAWGSKTNNEDKVESFAEMLSKYAHRLRGFTAYPDGARGGQPLVEVDYETAVNHKGVVYEENIQCSSGVCGI